MISKIEDNNYKLAGSISPKILERCGYIKPEESQFHTSMEMEIKTALLFGKSWSKLLDDLETKEKKE